MTLEFEAPIRIESVNRTRDQHWSKRKRRADSQQGAIYWAYRTATGPNWKLFASKPFASARPLVVTLTRIAPRAIDDDNNVAGCKAVRDAVAELLEADDGDSRITWIYRQERGTPRKYAVRVRIEAGSPCVHCGAAEASRLHGHGIPAGERETIHEYASKETTRQ